MYTLICSLLNTFQFLSPLQEQVINFSSETYFQVLLTKWIRRFFEFATFYWRLWLGGCNKELKKKLYDQNFSLHLIYIEVFKFCIGQTGNCSLTLFNFHTISLQGENIDSPKFHQCHQHEQHYKNLVRVCLHLVHPVA